MFTFWHRYFSRFAVDFAGTLQPLFHKVHDAFRRGYAVLRFLLKGVQHIHRLFQLHRVDRAERVAAMIGNHLQHSGPDVLQRLGVDVLAAHLRLIESKANLLLHGFWKLQQSAV